MSDNQNNKVSLWGRLGVQIDLTPDEFNILQKNDTAARDLLINLIKSDRCSLSGESYFPLEPNEKHLTEELEFDIDYQPIQKQQSTEDALDVFIESEVPFRLSEFLKIDTSTDVVQKLIQEVKVNTDVMFNYDRFDNFLMEKYKKLSRIDQRVCKDLQDIIYSCEEMSKNSENNLECYGNKDKVR